ncbi:MAG TPA: hypothetical protein VGR96_08340 [Acidobacteriaceae bacterium]|nr:hypothetical protein [Acidobacteriaceae bacterium]
MKLSVAGLLSLAVCLGGPAGCHVQIQKGGDGEAKDVQIATPLGGIDVKTNHTSAQDLGLPEYPGARLAAGHEGEQSANVNLGFGSWRLHVKVASYDSSDPQEKVIAFYRKALGAYGDVIECSGEKPVGTPAVTREGLSCHDSGRSHDELSSHEGEVQLRAGSPYHQHLVAFKAPNGEGTRFALIALDLPHGGHGHQETN